MGYRDSMQWAAAIQLMLEQTGLNIFQHRKCFANGCLQPAFERLLEMRKKLSHGERVLVDVAWDMWTCEKNLKLMELLVLSPRNVELVFGLFLASMQPDFGEAVDAWIMKQKERGND